MKRGDQMKSSVKLGVILIGLAIFSYAEAWGDAWKTFYSSGYGVYSYDTENLIRPDKGVVKVRVKIVYGVKGVSDLVNKYGDKFENISSGIVLFEVRCSERTIRILSSTYYSMDGAVLLSDTPPNSEWGFITPRSVGESLHKAVCK